MTKGCRFPRRNGVGAPTIVFPSWGEGLQPSALTHCLIPSMTDSRSFGLRLGQESDVVDFPGDGQAAAGPAFQPYCVCLAIGSGFSTLEILVPSG